LLNWDDGRYDDKDVAAVTTAVAIDEARSIGEFIEGMLLHLLLVGCLYR
jgi:hypothetical protein